MLAVVARSKNTEVHHPRRRTTTVQAGKQRARAPHATTFELEHHLATINPRGSNRSKRSGYQEVRPYRTRFHSQTELDGSNGGPRVKAVLSPAKEETWMTLSKPERKPPHKPVWPRIEPTRAYQVSSTFLAFYKKSLGAACGVKVTSKQVPIN